MSNDTIPEWAFDRAFKLLQVEGQPNNRDYVVGTYGCMALARYIAATEEAPVDPLLVEARDMVARNNHDEWTDSPWHLNEAAELRAGNRDYTCILKAAHAGIKRGIEIGKQS